MDAFETAKMHFLQGIAYLEQNKWHEGEACFRQSLALVPNRPSTLNNLAVALLKSRQFVEAAEVIRQVMTIDPTSPEAWLNQGLLHKGTGDLPSAMQSFDKAIDLQPDYPEAWLNKGAALDDQNRNEEAISSFDKAIAVKADFDTACFNRGMTLLKLKQYQAAVDSFERAAQINIDMDCLIGNLVFAKMMICDWVDLDRLQARLIRQIEQGGLVTSLPLGILALCSRADLQYQALRTYATHLQPAIEDLGPIARRPKQSKIRLGYYSADFRTHPVSLLAAEFFELHDRSKFELVAFAFGPDTSDPLRLRIKRTFDQFIDVQNQSDPEVAQLSRETGIDIAINLGGYTDGSRTGIFARRAAPIQVNYLGFPATMGAEYMDYLITDRIVSPESGQPYYTEKLAYLPHSFMPRDSTQPAAGTALRRSDFSLPESGFVFCCFNNNYKFNPEVFEIWVRLLRNVDDSVLFLLADNQAAEENLRREAKARGIAPTRLVFAGRVEYSLYLARYRVCDLFLDTMPYNAGTTASDALWAGLPVLTRSGEAFASRMAASLLHAVGLFELVTRTAEEYEALALTLARDPQRLDAIRQKLASNRFAMPLFDTRRFTRDIEALYATMYQRYLDGHPPASINV